MPNLNRVCTKLYNTNIHKADDRRKNRENKSTLFLTNHEELGAQKWVKVWNI